jgi:type III restriction enzyme
MPARGTSAEAFDPLKEVKVQAAHRWVDAVNADGRHSQWRYALAGKVADVELALRGSVVEPS